MVLNALAVLLVLLSVSGPSAELDRMQHTGDVDAGRVAEVVTSTEADTQNLTGVEACRAKFLAGELYRQADALVPGAGYAQKALELFRAMRVDHMDLSAGLLGYIGEARVHLQRGDTQESLASLAPILGPRTDPAILRLAQLQAMEAELLIDPKLALTRAPEVGDAGDWVRARAYRLLGDDESALRHARTEAAKRSASAFDRLGLIAELGALTNDERIAWAKELVAVERDDEALALLDSEDTGADRLHAALLHAAGRYTEACEYWRKAVDHDPDAQAMMAFGRSLEALAAQSNENEIARHRQRAAELYEHVVMLNDVDQDTRRSAMRRWFDVLGTDAPRGFIAEQADLIRTDPYLRYARLRVLGDKVELSEWLNELQSIADETQDTQLKALALIAWAENEPDPRAALAILNEQWPLLSSQPDTSERANERRAALWVELGMIDHAVRQLDADPSSGSARSILTIASALAERYTDGVQDGAQARVIELTGSALAKSPTDASIALDAARLLVKVEAYSDAVRILESLHTPEAVLVIAGALRELGRTDDALTRLADNDSPEAALLRSLCEYDLQRFGRALEEARTARSGSQAGSDTWWRATLALVKAHLAMDEPGAADDVLRVSEALYPVNGRAWLVEALKQVKKESNG